jgi:hypothetical protein
MAISNSKDATTSIKGRDGEKEGEKKCLVLKQAYDEDETGLLHRQWRHSEKAYPVKIKRSETERDDEL